MLVMGRIKGGVVDNPRRYSWILIGCNLLVVQGVLQIGLDFGGNLGLFSITAKNDAGILSPGIIALSIQSGGIMKGKEESNQLLKQFWSGLIEVNVQNFNVPRRAAADGAITWISDGILVRAHESDFGILDTTWELGLEVFDNVLFSAPWKLNDCSSDTGSGLDHGRKRRAEMRRKQDSVDPSS